MVISHLFRLTTRNGKKFERVFYAMEITVDEIIIEFVRENKCLYDKFDKEFKNSQKKKDLWLKISGNLKTIYDVNMTVEAVEKRWCSLRDMFSRESRRQKLLPSGSGYEPKKEWNLYKNMQFLSSHIAHRRTKASLQSTSQNILSGTSTERNEFSSSSDHFSTINSPSPFVDHSYVGNIESVNEKEVIISSVDHDRIGTPTSTISSSDSSICQQFSTPNRNTNSRFSNSPRKFKRNEKVTPEVDHFVKRRKCRDDLLQQDLEKTCSSISNALKSVENVMFDRKSCSRDSYMLALEEGLKHVPAINKTQCLIEMLQVIQKYEDRQS